MPALVLFAFGLAMQLAFALAGPDGGAGWHIGFQGDAPVWQDLAHKLANGIVDDQLRLPWRPPGMQWLVATLWHGDPAHVLPVRVLFATCAAAIAPLLWLLLRRHVAAGVALLSAGLCAVGGNVLLLGSGLHVETLYLGLVLIALFEQERLARARPWAAALRFGLLHGALCLLRAEHLVTAAVLVLVARRTGAKWRPLLLAIATAAAVIAPWQWHAHNLVTAYGAGEPPLPPAALPWQPEAIARLRTLESFHQQSTYAFVTDTMRTRGAREVTAADLDVVREAYGCWPEPLRAGFIAAYGGLNFFLANTPEAAGGFSTRALDRPPPLTGGDHLYPRGLRQVLPKNGQLAFNYPVHLELIVNGFARGLDEITADPASAAGRCLRKLWHAIEGAVPTLGGYALPIGLSGQRRQVDLVTATGAWPIAWRWLVVAAAASGLWLLRQNRAIWPLLAFAATKLLVVFVYFGYARQGALCLPVVAVGIAAAVHTFAPGLLATAKSRRIGIAALAVLLAVELLRAATTSATVDGRAVTAGEPFGPRDFTARSVVFR